MAPPAVAPGSSRDPRVDFFRGLAFIIILIAHIPSNWMARWIPARFGWSDATEMFVFMSGYAAGIAFGSSFVKAGWWIGTARIGYRVWQVYVAHLTLFFFLAMFMVLATDLFDTRDYVRQLNLTYFFEHTPRAMVGLFTMTYVPNYFDILPMYIVVLAMMPFLVALARYIHPWAAIGAMVVIYLANWQFGLGLPAEVREGSDRVWFFNPFGWQLIFFTGFGLAVGWLKPPPVSRWLFAAAVALIIVGVALGHHPIWSNVDTLREIREAIRPWLNKTDFGILRYVHFLALAYVTVVLLRGHEHLLRSRWGAPIMQCGQQSLPVFLFSMAFSRFAGITLDHTGREQVWVVVLVNAAFIGLLIGLAYLLRWLKSEPWRKRRPDQQPAPPPRPAPTPAPATRAAE